MRRLRFLSLASCLIAAAGCSPRAKNGAAVERRSSALTSAPIDDVVALGAGVGSACAVLSSGRVACWGSLMLPDGTATLADVPTLVPGITDAQDVAVGVLFNCVLSHSGTVACWGTDTDQESGVVVPGIALTPTDMGLTNVVAISAGDHHTCAFISGGQVACWGERHLGNGVRGASGTPVTVSNLGDATAIGAGSEHTCAVRSAGGVVCWGQGADGELGDGNGATSEVPVAVTGLGGVAVSVSAGFNHACARLADHTISCWGGNLGGELGPNGGTGSLVPVSVPNIGDASDVAAGVLRTCVIRSGGVVSCWGEGAEGELGNGAFASSTTPVTVSNLQGVVHVTTSGHVVSCALRSTGQVLCWGTGVNGELGNGKSAQVSVPVDVSNLPNAVAVTAGDEYTCALSQGGTVDCWGSSGPGFFGLPTLATASFVSAHRTRVCAVATGGHVSCWSVSSGQVVSAATTISAIASPSAIAASAAGGCGILQNKSVACWGTTTRGELGNGSMNASSPAQAIAVSNLGDAVAIAAGNQHTCVVLGSGGVSCWGAGDSGELGNGGTADSAVPVTVTGISDATAVVCGYSFSCAIHGGGKVACWGQGVLPGGPSVTSSTPVDLSTIMDAASFTQSGARHVCVVRTAGGVACWGTNDTGQLGDGTFTASSDPVDVVDLTDAVDVVGGPGHSCALRQAGQVACWGEDGAGQLGDFGAFVSAVPVNVVGLSKGVTCGVDGDCASGFCVDGVCCASACGGNDPSDCQACSAAAGAATDGTCAPLATSHVCRAKTDVCDLAAKCTGSSAACPANPFVASGSVCGTQTGPCDVAAKCTGMSAACPANPFVASGSVCGTQTGPCDVAAKCTGTSAACPANPFVAGGTTCQAAANACEQNAVCTGSDATCPALVQPPSCGLVSAGTGADVSLEGGIGVVGGFEIKCAGTASAGTITYTPGGSGNPSPGYEIVEGSLIPSTWSLTTTATCTNPMMGLPAPFLICFHYDPNSVNAGMETFLTLQHDAHDNNGFVSINSSPPSPNPNTSTHVVCGKTTSMSPFLLARPHTLPPVVTVPGDMTVEATSAAGATVTFAATASDPEDGALTPTCTPASGATFPRGATTVTCAVTDSSGVSASASFTINVTDTEGPVFGGVPGPIAAYATCTAGAKVTYTPPTARDAVDGPRPVSCAPASGSMFPLKTTTVKCTASDLHGHASNVTFPVTVTYQAPTDGSFFLSPIRADGRSVFHAGLPVPVRFKLQGASAGVTNLTANLIVTKISSAVQGTFDATSDESVDDTDFVFKYRPLFGWYAYRWRTRDQSQGTYQLRADLGDGVVHQVNVSLKSSK